MENKPNTEGKSTPYNRKDEVIADLFKKKINEFWSNPELKEYLVNHYGYTEQTAQRYVEDLWKKIKSIDLANYEDNLAATVNYMNEQIKECNEPFTRLQWVKERNKICGLHIQKMQVEGTVQNIHTIKIKSIRPAEQITEGESIPVDIPLKDAPVIAPNEES
jgi:hypothetical protein